MLWHEQASQLPVAYYIHSYSDIHCCLHIMIRVFACILQVASAHRCFTLYMAVVFSWVTVVLEVASACQCLLLPSSD